MLCGVQITLNDNANTDLSHSNPRGTNSADVLDNQEINDTLDQFTKMLSDYSCDGNPTDPAAPTGAQTRLESLFKPPDGTDSQSPAGPRHSATSLPDSAASVVKENPVSPAEDEASLR